MHVGVDNGCNGGRGLRLDEESGAAITSDAPRETSALVGYESLGHRAYRRAARTRRHSALRPRRRTWWLTGSAARSGTQRISGEHTKYSSI